MKKRILIVDDSAINRSLLFSILKIEGYEIFQAVNGADGLEKTREKSPDVILLDIMMPIMDGIETLNHLKDNDTTRFIPVVMVTALNEVKYRVKAIELGADDFVSKPVERHELTARVRSLLKVKAYNDHVLNYQKELEDMVNQRTLQLKEASLDTIYRLSLASDFKDQGTGDHIRRMSNFSAIIARQMGFSKDEVETILYAAPMHDVGKIGIPDKILLKPGKLSPEEWKIMRQHTTWGAKILEGSKIVYIETARLIALSHHERWDGNGYPQGLRQKEINQPARIVAIADVFDALISSRPYKHAFTIEQAFDIIYKSNGSHFDPEVSAAFFDSKNEIIEIMKQYSSGSAVSGFPCKAFTKSHSQASSV